MCQIVQMLKQRIKVTYGSLFCAFLLVILGCETVAWRQKRLAIEGLE